MDALLVVLGGVIAAVVQCFLTPRVQRSIRMHERREQALVELGRVLTEDVPSVRSRLMNTASVLEVIKQSIDSGEVEGTTRRSGNSSSGTARRSDRRAKTGDLCATVSTGSRTWRANASVPTI